MRGLTAPVSAQMLAYFAKQGWPLSILMHLFVGSIEVLDEDGKIVASLDNSPAAPTFGDYQQLVRRLGRCRLAASDERSYVLYGRPVLKEHLSDDPAKLAAAKAADLVPVPVTKDGKTDKEPDQAFTHVQYGHVNSEVRLRLIQETENHAVAYPETACRMTAAEGAPAPSTSQSAAFFGAFELAMEKRISVDNDDRQAARQLAQPATPVAAAPAPVRRLNLVMRSTQSMIYYLGELSRAYDAPEPGRAGGGGGLMIATGMGEAALFRMYRGAKMPEAAISVPYRSEYLNILPYRRADGATTDDRSVQTLALLSMVYTLHNRSGDPPSIRNIRVIP